LPNPDKPAVIVAGSSATLTYQQLEERSLRLARHLFDSGLRRGDHVALITDNDPKAFEVYWAALRSGLYITAVNRHLAPDDMRVAIHAAAPCPVETLRHSNTTRMRPRPHSLGTHSVRTGQPPETSDASTRRDFSFSPTERHS